MKLLLPLFLFFPALLVAQVGVNKNYHIAGNDNGLELILTDNGGYYLQVIDGDFSHRADNIIKTDSLGNEIWRKSYHSFTSNPIMELRQFALDGTDLVIASSVGTPDTSTVPVLTKLDSAGNILFQKVFGEDHQKLGKDIKVSDDSYYFLTSGGVQNTLVNTHLIKTDKQGNEIWNYEIDSRYIFSGGENFARLEDGSFLICLDVDTIPGLDPHFPSVIKMDSLGNTIWQTDLPLSGRDGGNVFELTLLKNKRTVIYSDFDSFPPPLPYQNVMAVLYGIDENGERIWTNKLLSEFTQYIYDIKTAKNGDIIGCGLMVEGQDVPAWIFRVSPEGELLWERRYRIDWTPVQFFKFSEIVEREDGTLAVVGRFRDTVPNERNDAWLVTVDSNGCFTPGCTDDDILLAVDEIDGERKLQELFFTYSPNPASHKVVLEFPNLVQRPNSAIHIRDINGFLVNSMKLTKGTSQVEIPTEDWSAGMYLIQYTSKGRLLQAEKVVVVR